MNKKWSPSESDLEWTKRTIQSLKVGGIWATTFALYKRTSEDTVKLVGKRGETEAHEESRGRVKKAVKLCGFNYEEEVNNYGD